MLRFVIGRAGAGKTTALIREIRENMEIKTWFHPKYISAGGASFNCGEAAPSLHFPLFNFHFCSKRLSILL